MAIPTVKILHKCDVGVKFSNPNQNTLRDNERTYAGQGACLVLLEQPLSKRGESKGAELQVWLYPLISSSRTRYGL